MMNCFDYGYSFNKGKKILNYLLCVQKENGAYVHVLANATMLMAMAFHIHLANDALLEKARSSEDLLVASFTALRKGLQIATNHPNDSHTCNIVVLRKGFASDITQE
ncbi:uncharacterized protein G2W53_021029 [Senna tora]|uniref:Uncharacterized protein n=1 Tax=Senna tora TaxID=362788 RepID=A0A834TJD7_9FABA|nr:uncharacterized protein G2W53_021029 [Senna tora]